MKLKARKQVRGLQALFLILWLSGFHALATEPPYIEVITSDSYPLTGIQVLEKQGVNVHVYNLDDGKRLLKGFAKHLPANQNAAKKTLEKRFKRLGNNVVKEQFMKAYQGVVLSTRYQLTRYPAVVFERGQSVIYGLTDLSQAFNLYQQWRNNDEY